MSSPVPQGSGRDSAASAASPVPQGSGRMFDGIAARYDFLNRAMSLGIDRRWRRKMIRSLDLNPGMRLLDLATGTADVAILAAREGAIVTGIDPSTKMLEIGREKVARETLAVTLQDGVAEELPFAAESFERITIAFGIRNVPDRPKALREMLRVCAPAGRLAILELTEPRGGFIAPFARFHVHEVIPRLGGLLSGSKEYRYLQQSIAAFPAAKAFAETMRECGWIVKRVEPLTFGTSHLFVAEKA